MNKGIRVCRFRGSGLREPGGAPTGACMDINM